MRFTATQCVSDGFLLSALPRGVATATDPSRRIANHPGRTIPATSSRLPQNMHLPSRSGIGSAMRVSACRTEVIGGVVKKPAGETAKGREYSLGTIAELRRVRIRYVECPERYLRVTGLSRGELRAWRWPNSSCHDSVYDVRQHAIYERHLSRFGRSKDREGDRWLMRQRHRSRFPMRGESQGQYQRLKYQRRRVNGGVG
jgi:hypothetical protein